VRKLRSQAGLSQEQLAAQAGVNRTYLGDVERGERNVAVVNISKVAKALGISLGSLMTAVDRELARGRR
jgi:transcriptional regulator with XRE-family HTH domain